MKALSAVVLCLVVMNGFPSPALADLDESNDHSLRIWLELPHYNPMNTAFDIVVYIENAEPFDQAITLALEVNGSTDYEQDHTVKEDQIFTQSISITKAAVGFYHVVAKANTDREYVANDWFRVYEQADSPYLWLEHPKTVFENEIFSVEIYLTNKGAITEAFTTKLYVNGSLSHELTDTVKVDETFNENVTLTLSPVGLYNLTCTTAAATQQNQCFASFIEVRPAMKLDPDWQIEFKQSSYYFFENDTGTIELCIVNNGENTALTALSFTINDSVAYSDLNVEMTSKTKRTVTIDLTANSSALWYSGTGYYACHASLEVDERSTLTSTVDLWIRDTKIIRTFSLTAPKFLFLNESSSITLHYDSNDGGDVTGLFAIHINASVVHSTDHLSQGWNSFAIHANESSSWFVGPGFYEVGAEITIGSDHYEYTEWFWVYGGTKDIRIIFNAHTQNVLSSATILLHPWVWNYYYEIVAFSAELFISGIGSVWTDSGILHTTDHTYASPAPSYAPTIDITSDIPSAGYYELEFNLTAVGMVFTSRDWIYVHASSPVFALTNSYPSYVPPGSTTTLWHYIDYDGVVDDLIDIELSVDDQIIWSKANVVIKAGEALILDNQTTWGLSGIHEPQIRVYSHNQAQTYEAKGWVEVTWQSWILEPDLGWASPPIQAGDLVDYCMAIDTVGNTPSYDLVFPEVNAALYVNGSLLYSEESIALTWGASYDWAHYGQWRFLEKGFHNLTFVIETVEWVSVTDFWVHVSQPVATFDVWLARPEGEFSHHWLFIEPAFTSFSDRVNWTLYANGTVLQSGLKDFINHSGMVRDPSTTKCYIPVAIAVWTPGYYDLRLEVEYHDDQWWTIARIWIKALYPDFRLFIRALPSVPVAEEFSISIQIASMNSWFTVTEGDVAAAWEACLQMVTGASTLEIALWANNTLLFSKADVPHAPAQTTQFAFSHSISTPGYYETTLRVELGNMIWETSDHILVEEERHAIFIWIESPPYVEKDETFEASLVFEEWGNSPNHFHYSVSVDDQLIADSVDRIVGARSHVEHQLILTINELGYHQITITAFSNTESVEYTVWTYLWCLESLTTSEKGKSETSPVGGYAIIISLLTSIGILKRKRENKRKIIV